MKLKVGRAQLWLAFVWLLCISAGLAIDLAWFPPSVVFPDESRLLDSAIHLAQTGEFRVGADRAWEMPGTALWFSVGVRLFGPDTAILAIRAAQSLLIVIQSMLIGIMALRIFSDRLTAIVAASVVSVYPFFLFYQGLLLSETLFNTLLVAAFASLYWWRDRGMKIDVALLITNILFVAATMTKATLTFLPPLLIAAAALNGQRSVRRVSSVLVASSLLFAVFMSPWWMRNYIAFGSFVPFSTSAASNLYIGNNTNNPNARIDWRTDVDTDFVKRVSAIEDERVRQREYFSAALSYIVHEPGAFLDRAAKKFVRFWNIVPNVAEYNQGSYRAISAATFGPVLLLAIASAVRWRRNWRMFLPIYVLVIYFTLLHTVTIASLRYRLPLEPFLILMAAWPLAQAYRWIWSSKVGGFSKENSEARRQM